LKKTTEGNGCQHKPKNSRKFSAGASRTAPKVVTLI
jgi:hypothetical protein